MKIRDSDSTALSHRAGTLQSQEVTQFKVETLSQKVGMCYLTSVSCACGVVGSVRCDETWVTAVSTADTQGQLREPLTLDNYK